MLELSLQREINGIMIYLGEIIDGIKINNSRKQKILKLVNFLTHDEIINLKEKIETEQNKEKIFDLLINYFKDSIKFKLPTIGINNSITSDILKELDIDTLLYISEVIRQGVNMANRSNISFNDKELIEIEIKKLKEIIQFIKIIDGIKINSSKKQKILKLVNFLTRDEIINTKEKIKEEMDKILIKYFKDNLKTKLLKKGITNIKANDILKELDLDTLLSINEFIGQGIDIINRSNVSNNIKPMLILERIKIIIQLIKLLKSKNIDITVDLYEYINNFNLLKLIPELHNKYRDKSNNIKQFSLDCVKIKKLLKEELIRLIKKKNLQFNEKIYDFLDYNDIIILKKTIE
jgi:hypothetical protein